nr:uncharacterized protein LOC116940027 isoform X2 [Petromyzon marinus]XP_032805155.1 uncharacterized protein LOC116940027 isoform X2 [Petromyzon marinus]XP_032805156.1 uncharacterized protein LOC116940027 isoform X2 [Petromyzon marinus]
MGTAGGGRRALPGWMLTGPDAPEHAGKPGSNPAGRGMQTASGSKGTARRGKTRTSRKSFSKLKGGPAQPIYCMSESELLHTALQFLPDISDTDSKEAIEVTATGTEERKGLKLTTTVEHLPSESQVLLGGTMSPHGRVSRPPLESEISGLQCSNATRPREDSVEDDGMNVLKEIFFKK